MPNELCCSLHELRTAIRVAHIVDGLLLLLFFVGVPAITAGIGCAAFKGRPKSFGRKNYVLATVACGLAGGVLLVYAQRMEADIRTWLYLWQIACGSIGLLLFGIAGGCGIGIFTCRFGPLARKPPE
jgi:hypothetical protein